MCFPVHSLSQTIISQVKTTWSAEDYVEDLTVRATGQNEKVEAKLREKYPPIFSPSLYYKKPCTVIDERGNLLLWYIPGALTLFRTVCYLSLRTGTEADRGSTDSNVARHENHRKVISGQEKW
jgi:hypothetical protein